MNIWIFWCAACTLLVLSAVVNRLVMSACTEHALFGRPRLDADPQDAHDMDYRYVFINYVSWILIALLLYGLAFLAYTLATRNETSRSTSLTTSPATTSLTMSPAATTTPPEMDGGNGDGVDPDGPSSLSESFHDFNLFISSHVNVPIRCATRVAGTYVFVSVVLATYLVECRYSDRLVMESKNVLDATQMFKSEWHRKIETDLDRSMVTGIENQKFTQRLIELLNSVNIVCMAFMLWTLKASASS